MGFEQSLDSLQSALVKLHAEKDNTREKIMMATRMQKQKLEEQQVPIGFSAWLLTFNCQKKISAYHHLIRTLKHFPFYCYFYSSTIDSFVI